MRQLRAAELPMSGLFWTVVVAMSGAAPFLTLLCERPPTAAFVSLLVALALLASFILIRTRVPAALGMILPLTCYAMSAPISAVTGGGGSGFWTSLFWGAGALAALLLGVDKAGRALLIGGSIQALIALLTYLSRTHVFVSGSVPRAQGPSGSPVTLAFMGGVLCLFAVHRWAGVDDPAAKRGWAALAAAIAGVVLVTFSRGAILALGLSVFLLLGNEGSTTARNRRVLALFALILFGCGARSLGTANWRHAAVSAASRPRIWSRALSDVAERPWTGDGVGGFAYSYERVSGATTTVHSLAEPKSLVLLPMVELGVVGIAIVGLTALSLAAAARRSWSDGDRLMGALAIFVLVAGLVDTPAFGPGEYQGTLLLGYVFGLMCMWATRAAASIPNSPRRAQVASVQRAFTLIELLVVVSVLAVLAGILYPVFASARRQAQKATAVSNSHQLAAATMLYGDDADDVFSPYFSGYDPATDTYNEPQRYWPHLVGVYIEPVKGRGALDQALADDLPRAFFDPIKPFKSQLSFPFQYGIVASWGVSDNIVDWYAPVGVTPTKRPLPRSSVASPTECLYLVETYDWLLNSGFPGNAISLSFFDRNGTGAAISVDAPHNARYPKSSPNSPADPTGLNIAVFCDGHVAATRVGELTGSGKHWSATGESVWR